MFVIFNQAEKRHINIHFPQNFFYYRNLTFTAVKQNQVGQFSEALVCLFGFIVFVKSSADNLFLSEEVIFMLFFVGRCDRI